MRGDPGLSDLRDTEGELRPSGATRGVDLSRDLESSGPPTDLVQRAVFRVSWGAALLLWELA
jgi:hypothetical protein